MSKPKKTINKVDIFSDLSLTARRIISQLLESNEKLQQENKQLRDDDSKNDKSEQDDIVLDVSNSNTQNLKPSKKNISTSKRIVIAVTISRISRVVFNILMSNHYSEGKT